MRASFGKTTTTRGGRAESEVGVRWWRPAALPDVEIIEADRTRLFYRAFGESYALALKTEAITGVRYRRGVHELCPGDILLLEPGETHAIVRTDGPMSGCVLLLPPALASRVAREFCGIEGAVHWQKVVAPRSTLSGEMSALVKALPRLRGAEAQMGVSRLVAQCVAQFAERVEVARVDQVPALALARARDLLHARWREPVTIHDLSRVSEGATSQRLIRSFRKAFGFTPHQYLTHLRLQGARDLLRQGRACGETAHAVGFYDQSQMNRHFMKHLGVTPGTYAKGGDLESRSRFGLVEA